MENSIRSPDKRLQRATTFANQLTHMLRRYIPDACLREAYDELHKIGYEGNVQLINVPPEWDALDKLAIERAMLETHPLWIKEGDVLWPKSSKPTP